jgi:hypothetical protein
LAASPTEALAKPRVVTTQATLRAAEVGDRVVDEVAFDGERVHAWVRL